MIIMCLWIVKLVHNQFESAMQKKLYDLKGQICNTTFCRNSGNSSSTRFTKCEFLDRSFECTNSNPSFPLLYDAGSQ